ncbi:hypothetical protein M8818_002442 [Zalaria obscura]|uniref:Uncharacterized protein n=1 Tax=Zalaria obscura TaxID=2024903 RepID=A0ACC3SIQ6_9PEZI
MIPTTYLEYLVRLLRYNEALERLLLNLHSSVTPGGVRLQGRPRIGGGDVMSDTSCCRIWMSQDERLLPPEISISIPTWRRGGSRVFHESGPNCTPTYR